MVLEDHLDLYLSIELVDCFMVNFVEIFSFDVVHSQSLVIVSFYCLLTYL